MPGVETLWQSGGGGWRPFRVLLLGFGGGSDAHDDALTDGLEE
jgi:hypothetical protein